MIQISGELEQEIERRMAERGVESAEEFLRFALESTDFCKRKAEEWLAGELRASLEGPGRELSDEDWEQLEQEAIRRAELRKSA